MSLHKESVRSYLSWVPEGQGRDLGGFAKHLGLVVGKDRGRRAAREGSGMDTPPQRQPALYLKYPTATSSR